MRDAKFTPIHTEYMEGSPVKAYLERFRQLEVPDYVIGDKTRNYEITDSNFVWHHLTSQSNRQVYCLEPLAEFEVKLMQDFQAWADENKL